MVCSSIRFQLCAAIDSMSNNRLVLRMRKLVTDRVETILKLTSSTRFVHNRVMFSTTDENEINFA